MTVPIGVRARDFGKLEPEELGKQIAARGFGSTQLVLRTSVDGIDVSRGKFNPGMAHYIGDTLAKHDVRIAVLGAYINPIHPDPEVRKQELDYFKEHLRFARDFGCSIVGTETGSPTGDTSADPEALRDQAFPMLIESVRELVEEAEKFGVIVGIEGAKAHVLSTPERLGQLIDAVPSNNLQVIYDPYNFLTDNNYQRQDDIAQDMFDRFGEKILALHAKDFVVEQGRLKEVPVGRGDMNYELLLKLLKTHKPYADILLEGQPLDSSEEHINYLRTIYEKI